MSPRFRTDADLAGVEKIAVAEVPNEYLEAPYEPLGPLHRGSS